MRRFAIIVPILLLTGCGGSATPPPAQAPSVQVETVRPVWGSLPATVLAYGSAAPAVNGAQTISMAQPGQVTSLVVSPGAAVRVGQALATFVTAPSVRSAYQQAADALVAARKQRTTTAQLLSQQLATTDQLAQSEKAVADARAAVAALAAEGADRASRTIVAPFSGVVTAVGAAQGDRLQPGAAIVTIARAGGIVVTVGIDPANRAEVAVGAPATLKRLAGGGDLVGRVVRVDSALNARTRMVDVDVGFPAGALLPGEAMQVAIETGRVSGWVVPHRAVVTANAPPRVFQVVGGKAKAVSVRIALVGGANDVVTGAVDGASPLIVAGAYQVSDGDAVRTGR